MGHKNRECIARGDYTSPENRPALTVWNRNCKRPTKYLFLPNRLKNVSSLTEARFFLLFPLRSNFIAKSLRMCQKSMGNNQEILKFSSIHFRCAGRPPTFPLFWFDSLFPYPDRTDLQIPGPPVQYICSSFSSWIRPGLDATSPLRSRTPVGRISANRFLAVLTSVMSWPLINGY